MPRWDNLPQNVKGLVAVVASVAALVSTAFAVGAATADTRAEFQDIPQRVEALEVSDVAQDSILARFGRDGTALAQRNAAVVDTLIGAMTEVQCILRAQVEGTPADRCLRTYRR